MLHSPPLPPPTSERILQSMAVRRVPIFIQSEIWSYLPMCVALQD